MIDESPPADAKPLGSRDELNDFERFRPQINPQKTLLGVRHDYWTDMSVQ